MATYPQSQSVASEPGFGRFIWNIFRCLSHSVLQHRQLIWEAHNLCVSGKRRVAEGLRLLLMAQILKLCSWPPAASPLACTRFKGNIFFAETRPQNDDEHLNCCCKRGGRGTGFGGEMQQEGQHKPPSGTFTCFYVKCLSPLCFTLSLKVQCVKIIFRTIS